ncbi:MAG: F-type H+-transporting ATPase subunit epsilon [Bradymonadia bacterium]|jgi:F-type H+-transporting ATPase subunit epsilon
MAKMRVEIVTPTGSVLDVEANSVRIPGAVGEADILPGHRPAVIMLSGGKILLEGSTGPSDAGETVAIRGGVAEVRRDGVLILADEATTLSDFGQDEARAGLRALNESMTSGTLDNERLLRIEADRRFFEAILSA